MDCVTLNKRQMVFYGKKIEMSEKNANKSRKKLLLNKT